MTSIHQDLQCYLELSISTVSYNLMWDAMVFIVIQIRIHFCTVFQPGRSNKKTKVENRNIIITEIKNISKFYRLDEGPKGPMDDLNFIENPQTPRRTTALGPGPPLQF